MTHYIDPDELAEARADYAQPKRGGFCGECWRVGGHAIGCPNEPEDEGEDDEQE